jgi:hypothetical protein
MKAELKARHKEQFITSLAITAQIGCYTVLSGGVDIFLKRYDECKNLLIKRRVVKVCG